VFQGVISCLAAFWVKRNTALCTYKSEYTLWQLLLVCFVSDLLNKHPACMCCNQQGINVIICFPWSSACVLYYCSTVKNETMFTRQSLSWRECRSTFCFLQKLPLLSSTF
jgi:hypothetical protein